MKKSKRYLAGLMSAVLLVGSMAVPTFAAPAETGAASKITVVTDNKSSAYTTNLYYANGNPVTIEEKDGVTYIHEDSVTDQSQWIKLQWPSTVIAGGTTGAEAINTKVTMKSGTVGIIVASSSGDTTKTDTYHVGNAIVDVQGGTVSWICANKAIDSGNGAFDKCGDYMVDSCEITVSGDAVVGDLYGCYGYTEIGNLDVKVTGNAKVTKTLLMGASNGRLTEGTVTIDGPGVVIGEIAGCQRTLIDNLTFNLNQGRMTEAISVGSIYNQSENYTNYWKNASGLGNIHYGVVKDITLNIGKDFDYQGIYAGFQFLPEEVKHFNEKFNKEGTNNGTICTEYGLDAADGKLGTTAVINLEKEPSGPKAQYKYLGLYDAVYEGAVPNLFKEPVPGVTVNSAPKSISVTPEKLSVNVDATAALQAEVTMLAPLASPSNAVRWTSSDETVAVVDENGVVTGKDIGAAVITASYTETVNGKDVSVEKEIPVSVGGEFDIAVNPKTIRLGDTVTFQASAKKTSASALRAATATASNADYVWEISNEEILADLKAEDRTLTGEAVMAGTATAKLVYDNGELEKPAEGNASFTVTAPAFTLTAPASVALGEKFKPEIRISNVGGTGAELVEKTLESDGTWLVPVENEEGTFVAIDVPTAEDKAVIHGSIQYPAVENGSEEKETAVAVTVPALAGESVTLTTDAVTEKSWTLPSLIQKLLGYGADVAAVSRDESMAVCEISEDGKQLLVKLSENAKAGSTTVDLVLTGSGTTLVSYTVLAEEQGPTTEGAKDGTAEVIVPEKEEIPTPVLPEGAESLTKEHEEKAEAAKDAIVKLAENKAVMGNEKSVQNLASAVKANGLLENDAQNVEVALNQKLKNVELETVVKKDTAGNPVGVEVLTKKLVFDVTAQMVIYDENGVKLEEKPLDLSSGKVTRRQYFTFRLPVPENVTTKYANVEHEGDTKKQYAIETENGHKFISVRTWHLSDFTVTFTNDRLYTGSGNSGGGGSVRSYQAKDVKAQLTGTWIQNETGWWFRYSNGTWPANKWVELEWNGVRSWYSFNAEGYMENGWKLENGLWYYLHPYADGTQGYMYTGWHEIGGKWYYFSTVAGGPLGSMAANTTTPDGYPVGTDGAWIR